MLKYLLLTGQRDTLLEMRRLWGAVLAAQIAIAAQPALAADVAWEPWQKIAGVVDVDGPRTDGSLIVAGSAALYLVDPAGQITPFARGPGGYRDDPGAEAYLARSPGAAVSAAGCSFTADDTFVLRLHIPIGINRVSASGEESGSFANLTGVTTLNGIAFDNTGAFDHRLLVSGPSRGKTTIFAIDCNGDVKVVTRSAPALEGGLAVAPSTFGAFAGALIAPDELSGKIYAITAAGAVSVVAKPSLRVGADIGVEGVGFVPAGFISRGGAAYYADRLSRNNPHPGSDSLLRLPSEQLGSAGVNDGDLLAATEGGAKVVAVHCEASCKVIPVITKESKAHGEGHIAFVLNPAPPSPIASTPSTGPVLSISPRLVQFTGDWGIPATALVLLLGLLALLGIKSFRRRGH
jgi:hypothetical protein